MAKVIDYASKVSELEKKIDDKDADVKNEIKKQADANSKHKHHHQAHKDS